MKDSGLIWVAMLYSIILLAILGGVSYAVWNKPDPIIMCVPLPILQWAFVGGMVGVLYQLGFCQRTMIDGARFYVWLVAKPVVGLVMGAIVYFLAVSGELALNGQTSIKNVEFLNVLAFVGGFSDRFSVDLLNRIVGRSGVARQNQGDAT